MSAHENTVENLAKFICEKSGIVSCLPMIANGVEEQISGEYESINDEEEDSSAPSYGGLCYTTYHIIDEGKIVRRVDRNINDLQRGLLQRLTTDGTLAFHVWRDDWLKHEYSFMISLPSSPNVADSKRLELHIEIKCSAYNAREFSLSAAIDPDISTEEVSKIAVMYSLAY